MPTTRRDFLKLLGLGAATAAVSASGISIVEAEPVRRYWQVGAQLQRGGGAPEFPGTVRLPNGELIQLRDFSESDKYDTIVIPSQQMETIGNAYSGEIVIDEAHRMPADVMRRINHDIATRTCWAERNNYKSISLYDFQLGSLRTQ